MLNSSVLLSYRIAVIATSLAASPLLGQSARREASPSERRTYLRQPNGLEKLSSVVGDITFEEIAERWGEHTLSSLVEQSDVIIKSNVLQRESHLSSDGDDILTNYTLNVLSPIKGEPASFITVTGRGGSLRLSTGYLATIHTKLWDSLQPGQTIIVFLKRVDNQFQVVGDIQGMIQVDSSIDRVQLGDRDASHNIALRRAADGVSSSTFEALIKHEAHSHSEQ